jgi:hypothetical protein
MNNEIPNRQHYKVESIDSELNMKYVPKKAYDTELKAQEMCFFLNLQPTSITKMVAYKCPVCQKWHIGHGGKIIDANEREKIRLQYEKWKIVNKRFG